ncbi:MAG TPA: porin, partial [Propylenella sp.]
DLSAAYIEIINDWGTFTAGRRGSFFDFWGAHGYGTRIQIDESTVDTNLFGWTFAAGNGFSFTIAAEDPASSASKPRRRTTIPGGSDDDYEGQEAPDGVANIRVDQSWGSAQIMGAVRHVHDYSGPVVNPVPPPILFGDATSDDGIGFAVGAGLTLRLPGGWRFDSQGGYAEGAVAYVTDDPGALGDLDGDFPDDLNKAWSVRAGIIGPFINPNLSVWLDGSFTHVEEDGGGTPDADEYDQWAFKIGARWEPVPGLGMGPEFAYQSLDMDDVANPGTVEEQPSFDVWGLMWRIQRNF